MASKLKLFLFLAKYRKFLVPALVVLVAIGVYLAFFR